MNADTTPLSHGPSPCAVSTKRSHSSRTAAMSA